MKRCMAGPTWTVAPHCAPKFRFSGGKTNICVFIYRWMDRYQFQRPRFKKAYTTTRYRPTVAQTPSSKKNEKRNISTSTLPLQKCPNRDTVSRHRSPNRDEQKSQSNRSRLRQDRIRLNRPGDSAVSRKAKRQKGEEGVTVTPSCACTRSAECPTAVWTRSAECVTFWVASQP